MQKELIQALLENFKKWSFTLTSQNNILHDKCKLLEFNEHYIMFFDYEKHIALQYNTILDMKPNIETQDVIILIGETWRII